MGKQARDGVRRIRFWYDCPGKARVCLAASFNNWSAVRMRRRGDRCTASVDLVPGRYEYKYVVDGEWVADPENPEWVVNEHGTLNSVLRVG